MGHIENTTQRRLSATTMTSVGLSTGGKIFFGGLTAGTFGLGCWQVVRYSEKIEQMEQRERELRMVPTMDFESKDFPYQRKKLTGTFLHDKEVLVGPRGGPLDPKAGTAVAGGGGMGPSPQGFMVLTPLQLQHGQLVWINRGWVPKAMVPGADPRGGRLSQLVAPEDINNWNRPKGSIHVTAIRSKAERTLPNNHKISGFFNLVDIGRFDSFHLIPHLPCFLSLLIGNEIEPKMIAIEHDYSKRPLQLFWMDGLALQAIAGQMQGETILLTEINPTSSIGAADDPQSSSRSNPNDDDYKFPRRPTIQSLAEFKTTPAIHAGYATTWYGLSVAGIYMTRKLITRGRS